VAEGATPQLVAVPLEVTVPRVREVSPDRAAAAVKAGRSLVANAGTRVDNEDTQVANADTRVANAGTHAASTAEAIAAGANAAKVIVAGMAIAAVFTDTTALRIITAAATATIPDITITIAAPATTINGATGFRPAPMIPTTILTSQTAA